MDNCNSDNEKMKEHNVYLIFHFNRLSSIEVCPAAISPRRYLYEWLKAKNMVHLVEEFSIGTWDKEQNARGGIEILYFGKEKDG